MESIVILFLFLGATALAVAPAIATGKESHMFIIHSPAFSEGATIPREYTCEGGDTSPELVWSAAPAGTKSFALIMDDPDAPAGVWTHWVVFDIPPSLSSLARGHAPKGTMEGKQSSGSVGYHGPCPPRGHGPHRYYFTLYALDCATLGAKTGASREAVAKAMQGHILGQASCMGRYERK